MRQFERLDYSALMEMLADFTSRYTKMIASGAPREESETYRKIILALQSEVATRKNSQGRSNSSETQEANYW